MPAVSVVIPTHNRARLLEVTLASVLGQAEVDLEAVVVDDGSTDATPALLDGLADPRLVVVRHAEAQGVARARNAGIERARGEWVAFCDSDDLWAPAKLASQLAAAAAAGCAWAYAGAVSVDGDLRVVAAGPPLPPDLVARDLPVRNRVPAGASNVAVRASVLERAGTFDPSLRHMADWDLWIRIGAQGPPACAPAPLVAYRQHSGNASLDLGSIVAELDVLGPRHADLRDGRRMDTAAVHRWVAWSQLRAGQPLAASRSYARAVRAGDWGALPRVAVALGGRRAARRAARRHVSDDAMAAEAEAWLAPLRALQGRP